MKYSKRLPRGRCPECGADDVALLPDGRPVENHLRGVRHANGAVRASTEKPPPPLTRTERALLVDALEGPVALEGRDCELAQRLKRRGLYEWIQGQGWRTTPAGKAELERKVS